MTGLQAVLMTIVTASTPLLLAAIGELVVERSGVLNLGIEGMMIIGAVSGFVTAHLFSSTFIGVVAAVLMGIVMALLFAYFTQTLVTNQVATGLALTLLGLGIAGLIGEKFTGIPGVKLQSIYVPNLTNIPLVGRLLFGQDVIVYISIALTIAVTYTIKNTRLGLIIRSIGSNHHSAHSLGYPVVAIRYCCIAFGGACAGLAGGYLSLSYTPQWIENMTAGRGWIALALVVFSSWSPIRAVIGAYLFGAVWIMGLYIQGMGIAVPAQLLSALPYLATTVALVFISKNQFLTQRNTPSCLGQSFVAEH